MSRPGMVRSGFFLVVEGPEGAGKSTLVRALAARLREAGVEPVVTREPGGTDAAEALRRELLDPSRRFDPAAELLYLAAARADLVGKVIRPALAEGRVVISDRFDLSTRAYQGAGRGIEPALLEWVNAAATGGLRPDLTIVLDLPVEVGRERQRASGKPRDRVEQEELAFHRRVAAAYREAAGPGIVHLDATQPPGRVLEAAWEALGRARGALAAPPAPN